MIRGKKYNVDGSIVLHADLSVTGKYGTGVDIDLGNVNDVGIDISGSTGIGISSTRPIAVTGISLPVATKTANYTVTTSDSLIRVDDDGAAADVTITLPTVASAWDATLSTGQVITVKKLGISYDVIISGNGAELIDGVNTHTISKTNQYSSLTFQCNGTSWDII